MRLDQVPAQDSPTRFDEAAIGNMLYQLYKSPNVGFASIYRAIMGTHKTTPAYNTSVFSFANSLRPLLSDAGKSTLDALLAQIQVPGGANLDDWGTAVKSAGPTVPVTFAVLPVYVPLYPATVRSCTTTQYGTVNKLGTYNHLHLNISAASVYQLTIQQLVGNLVTTGFKVDVYQAGKLLPITPSTNNSVLYSFPAKGDYTADIAINSNLGPSTPRGTAPTCVAVSLTKDA
ncbi:hypothetical protein BUMB_03226c [Candidatus Paraburkholderia calva]|nr:hypothetical protein BUMB_03226c [Candidatus Paraburkholderia calva]